MTNDSYVEQFLYHLYIYELDFGLKSPWSFFEITTYDCHKEKLLETIKPFIDKVRVTYEKRMHITCRLKPDNLEKAINSIKDYFKERPEDLAFLILY